MEPDRPQRDHLAACVIAQQYSPATFVSLRFHFRKEKYGARFKCVTMSFLLVLHWVCMTFRCLKLHNPGTVRIYKTTRRLGQALSRHLSLLWTGFEPRLIRVGLMFDDVAVGQVFLTVRPFYCHDHSIKCSILKFQSSIIKAIHSLWQESFKYPPPLQLQGFTSQRTANLILTPAEPKASHNQQRIFWVKRYAAH